MFDDLPEAKPEHSERDTLIIKLMLQAPLRPTTPQADSGHLPLFIAADEPSLF